MNFLFLLLKNRFINLRRLVREGCPYSLFFQQGTYLDATKVEAIFPCEFLNLDYIDHPLE